MDEFIKVLGVILSIEVIAAIVLTPYYIIKTINELKKADWTYEQQKPNDLLLEDSDEHEVNKVDHDANEQT